MFSYNIFQWIMFFYIYCVFGWIFESTYVSLKSRRFVNRGFMKGPMIPIYGEGAIIMVIATYPVRGNFVLEFVIGVLGATLLEFAVGALMESLFKVKYWDYSNQPFNIKGYVCLSSTVCWGFLSVLLAEVIHIFVERFVFSLNVAVLISVISVITILFITDAATSAKEAWDLRIVLVALTKAKGEITMLQHQLEGKKEQITAQLNDRKELFVEDLLLRKNLIKNSLKGNRLSMVEVEGLKNKLEEELTKYQSLVEKLASSSSWILKRNPGATSKKFYEALESMKEHLELKRRK